MALIWRCEGEFDEGGCNGTSFEVFYDDWDDPPTHYLQCCTCGVIQAFEVKRNVC